MNFPKIKFECKIRKSQVSSLKNDEKTIQRTCRNLELLKIISIFIPEAMALESLNHTYYSIEDFKIADVFTKNFIDGYVLNGDLCCASTNNYENCQFLLSDKKLVLRLDRELYYSLAAVHLTKFLRKNEDDKMFVTFEVDLNYEHISKIRNELMSDEVDKLNINFLWKPKEEDVCPSSLAKFLTDMGYNVKECENKYLNNFQYSIKVPKIPSNPQLNDETYDEWSDLIERTSMIMLGCETDEMAPKSESDFIKIRSGSVLHYKGFIPCRIMDDLFKEIRSMLKDNSSFSYIALSSIPFSNLQRNLNTKLFFVTSENIYASE